MFIKNTENCIHYMWLSPFLLEKPSQNDDQF
jgi:hypothetical protein